MGFYGLFIYALVGLTGGFISGLAGIGGAIIMIPMLLYVPPLFGLENLGIQSISGITMFQVLVASGVGMLGHRKSNHVHPSLLKTMGSAIVAGSLIGALSSKYVGTNFLEGVFAVLALAAAVLMFLPRKESSSQEVEFNKPLAAAIAFVTGILAGLVGAGGAFILIPLMLYVLKIPLRVTVGTSLAIVFFSSLAGVIGKLGVGQVPVVITLAVVLGVTPGARLGSIISKRVPVRALHYLLAGLIGLSALKIWSGIF